MFAGPGCPPGASPFLNVLQAIIPGKTWTGNVGSFAPFWESASNELVKMLPDLAGKRVLDLGCGFGWHCQYAAEHGAQSVVGVDISEKMLRRAREQTSSKIRYICRPMEDLSFPDCSFDVALSSLALHYVRSFDDIAGSVGKWLSRGGDFVFSVEHPIFTAHGTQDWYRDEQGQRLHWPVDRYFYEGKRDANFLGEKVIKYHRTITTYVNDLIRAGFEITGLVEPTPPADWLESDPKIADEMRRPMMLIVSAELNYPDRS